MKQRSLAGYSPWGLKESDMIKWPSTTQHNVGLVIRFPGGAIVKQLPANAGDARDITLILESGRSPGVGNGNLLQYSWLENSMDRGAWQATIHGVTELDRTERSTPHTYSKKVRGSLWIFFSFCFHMSGWAHQIYVRARTWVKMKTLILCLLHKNPLLLYLKVLIVQ